MTSPLEPNTSSTSVNIAVRRLIQQLERSDIDTRSPRPVSASKPIPKVQYWTALWLHRWVILTAGVLAAVLGIVSTLPKTPIYQAKTTLEIEGLNDNFLNFKDVDPTARSISDPVSLPTQMKILESRTVLLRVIDKLKLDKRSEFANQTSSESAGGLGLGQWLPKRRSAALPPREQALLSMVNNLTVRVSGPTHILEVLFDSRNPQLAADVANTLASEFISQNVEARLQQGAQTAGFLSGQLNDLKTRLEKSEDELQAYAHATGLMFSGASNSTSGDSDRSGQSISQERLREIQAELSKAQAERALKQAEYQQTEKSAESSDVLNDPIVHDYQLKMAELKRQDAELTALLTPEHPKVQMVEAQIKELESAIAQGHRNVLDRLANDYKSALLRERILQGEYDKQSHVVSEEAEKTIHYDILKKEVDSNRQLYQSMLQHQKEAGIAAAQRLSGMRIVDAAPVPNAPYKPQPLRTGLLTGLLGTLLTAGIVVLQEVADRSLQKPGDAARYLNVLELGVIPAAKEELLGRRSESIRWSTKRQLDGVSNGERTLEFASKDSASLFNFDEAFQNVATSILLNGLQESQSRAYVITSPNPSEGKTTATTNIAMALARSNQRVLIIDADMRRPRLHDVFGVENDLGLSSVLAFSDQTTELWSAAVQSTRVKGLYIVPSGPPVGTGTHNLLYTRRTEALLRYYRQEFDVVLIDTPPMLHMSDARIAAKFADAVILLFRLGRTTRDEAIDVHKRLVEDGHEVLGVVLNDWVDKTASKYSSYKKYSDTYGKPSRDAVPSKAKPGRSIT